MVVFSYFFGCLVTFYLISDVTNFTLFDAGYIFLNDFIYLAEKSERAQVGLAEGGGEAGSPLSRESDAGLDPRTLRS